MNVESTLEADTKPGMCARDDPSMTPQTLFALNTFAGDSCRDAAFLQVISAPAAVAAFVGVQLVGPLARPAIQARHRHNGIERCLERHRVMSIGARDRDRQRDATSVYDKVSLAPELTSIRRVGTCHFAPGARDGCTINVGSRAIDLIVLTRATQH